MSEQIDRIERKINRMAHLIIALAALQVLMLAVLLLRALAPELMTWVLMPLGAGLVVLALLLRRPYRRG